MARIGSQNDQVILSEVSAAAAHALPLDDFETGQQDRRAYQHHGAHYSEKFFE
jgi:hypothetical protein